MRTKTLDKWTAEQRPIMVQVRRAVLSGRWKKHGSPEMDALIARIWDAYHAGILTWDQVKEASDSAKAEKRATFMRTMGAKAHAVKIGKGTTYRSHV